MKNLPRRLPHAARLPDKAHVLILDDQRFDRHRLARLCSGLDMECTVTNAKNLADFADVIDTARFDLVVIDYSLPDGTGFDALDTVRLSPRNCNAAVIMVSGHDQETIAQDALKAGCSDYINKDDLAPPAFRRAVTNALQKSRLTHAVEVEVVRSSETQAVLDKFATKCAQDIKPMVSRMMRQLRDLRRAEAGDADGTDGQVERVEESCMVLWEFLVDLESFGAPETPDLAGPLTATSTGVRKPPSPFARLPG